MDTNPAPHALQPRTPDNVELLTAGPPQSRPYAEVAVFEATMGLFDNATDMMNKLRASGAQRGCDAVVVGPPDSRASLRGTCVVYK
jgi:hypothetical protein